MNPEVNQYFEIGCGRCDLVGTPECKVNTWREPLELLRGILLAAPLNEELKWSQPTYTLNGKNIAMIAAFNDNCVLSFFKGSILNDPAGILELPGPNSRAARVIRFQDPQRVRELEPIIRALVEEAIVIEKKGLKVDSKGIAEHDFPLELSRMFEKDAELEKAFRELTPGRQRGYLIHFSAPKKSETRTTRIVRSREKILAGKGFHDR